MLEPSQGRRQPDGGVKTELVEKIRTIAQLCIKAALQEKVAASKEPVKQDLKKEQEKA